MLRFLVFSLFWCNVFADAHFLKTGGQKSIVGGKTAAEDHPHTHQVSLRYFSRHTCGGSIITDRKVLTAAHCVDGVQPIPIYVGKLEGGRVCTVSGWGALKAKGKIPNDLQELNTTTLTTTDCIMRQPSRRPIIRDEKQICVYSRYGQGLCSGDSGGPLVYRNKLVGITSWGRGCACGYPDIFTRVNYYINWINSLH